MINRVKISNFGPLEHINWEQIGPINLVIGGNGSGKTFLLKALYSGIRTLEEYQRGNDQRTAADIVAEKLYWTFQPEKIGDLVTKGAQAPLSFLINVDQRDFCYRFGKETTRNITTLENHVPPRDSNSVFLPAKEVLSLHHIILKTREQDHLFGFDDTYLDLARALRQPLRGGKNFAGFAKSRRELDKMLGGKVEYNDMTGIWQFKKGNQKYPIGVTAEGIRKIAILDTLLGNRYLTPDSLVFIDEPEAALHPRAISRLLDIVAELADTGIQFFLASHSYFVVHKLLLIALDKGMSIPVISASDDGWVCADLKDGMPENPIINETIRLYEQEVEIALQ